MSSYSFLSVTEERIHASAGRIGLFPAMGARIRLRRRQGRDDSGGGEWLMEAREEEGS
jgi:hypothetical protein